MNESTGVSVSFYLWSLLGAAGGIACVHLVMWIKRKREENAALDRVDKVNEKFNLERWLELSGRVRNLETEKVNQKRGFLCSFGEVEQRSQTRKAAKRETKIQDEASLWYKWPRSRKDDPWFMMSWAADFLMDEKIDFRDRLRIGSEIKKLVDARREYLREQDWKRRNKR